MSSNNPRNREIFEPNKPKERKVKLKAIIHEAEEGGYWA
jgi:hypothetical protein